MDVTADELAGVVDLFGGLTRAELERALEEAAFRADGGTVAADDLAEAIDEAVAAFALVRYDAATDVPPRSADGDGTDAPANGGETDAPADGAEPLLVAGPAAFPRVPAGAEDLPHILDVEPRRLDREALGEAVRERFAAAVDEALAGPPEDGADSDRARRLLEVSYDVEAWTPVDVTAERARLEAALEG